MSFSPSTPYPAQVRRPRRHRLRVGGHPRKAGQGAQRRIKTEISARCQSPRRRRWPARTTPASRRRSMSHHRAATPAARGRERARRQGNNQMVRKGEGKQGKQGGGGETRPLNTTQRNSRESETGIVPRPTADPHVSNWLNLPPAHKHTAPSSPNQHRH